MSSIYEEEISRLIKKDLSRIRLLNRKDPKHKDLSLLKSNVQSLKVELKQYQKAMEMFRKKPVQPVLNPVGSG
tara:strand:- start:114 stop:332 length:219 start_codon:yes stop_codon:yes gene_type:complete